MAKNLTTRFRQLFRPMNTNENGKEAIDEKDAAPTQAADALSDSHNPDMGTPETPEVSKASDSPEDKLLREAADWRDKYMRLAAEFDNFRKRSIKERADYIAAASADTIRELLSVLDDFDRAVKANESVEDLAVVKEGFVLIHQKMYKRLESKGLKPLDAVGKPFDTDFHEAITQIPAPSVDLKGKVVDEVEKGYTLHDKVIRFSKVVIGQ
jgi:molecular chaperone GrpE